MRAIAIAGAIFLVAVTAASGSRQQTSSTRIAQKAVEAPKLATSQVACVSAASCVSVGGPYVLVERAGKWKAVKSAASVELLSVACPSVGKCVASGRFGERRAVVLTQVGTKWHSSFPALPGQLADPSFPALPSVTCAAKGACAAVGSYDFPFATPMIVKEQSGTWGDGVEPPLPANAATSRKPNNPNAGGGLSLVSCPSALYCTAVGTYTTSKTFSQFGWFLSDSYNPPPVGRTLEPSVAQLPAGASAHADSERGGTSPFFGFTGLSCRSAGNCTAVGGYADRHDDQWGVIFTEHDGTWNRGAKAPAPANAGLNAAPANSFENPLASVSCATASNCAAIGWYVDKSHHRHGLLLTERNGTWRASELALPAGAPRNATVQLSSITCASRGNCVAIGDYASSGRTHGLIVVERGGKWTRGIKAALPANASRKPHTFLNSVSCASAKRCTVVGDYADRLGKTRGLLLSLRLR